MTDTISATINGLTPASRALAGLVLASVVALIARRVQLLTIGGAVAAIALGALTAWAGWAWALTLIAYFVAASVLSRIGRERKAARSAGIIEKSGPRDAMQVFANGGVYSIAAAASTLFAAEVLRPAALSALAASAADTWSTELGILLGGVPRSIISRTVVRIGESGGVTAAGMSGAVAGAILVAVCGLSMGISIVMAVVVTAAGIAGAFVDSVAGELIQAKRWCDACAEPTERKVHVCGNPTRHAAGVTWIGNDSVNLLATLAGFIVGLIISLLVSGGS